VIRFILLPGVEFVEFDSLGLETSGITCHFFLLPNMWIAFG